MNNKCYLKLIYTGDVITNLYYLQRYCCNYICNDISSVTTTSWESGLYLRRKIWEKYIVHSQKNLNIISWDLKKNSHRKLIIRLPLKSLGKTRIPNCFQIDKLIVTVFFYILKSKTLGPVSNYKVKWNTYISMKILWYWYSSKFRPKKDSAWKVLEKG